MNVIRNRFTLPACLLSLGCAAQADLVVYEFGGRASNTLKALGTNFVTGCVILAVAIVISAFVSKKK